MTEYSNDLEKAARFNADARNVISLANNLIEILKSGKVSQSLRETVASDFNEYKKFVQEVTEMTGTKYRGASFAENLREDARRKLIEFEKVAGPYLS